MTARFPRIKEYALVIDRVYNSTVDRSIAPDLCLQHNEMCRLEMSSAKSLTDHPRLRRLRSASAIARTIIKVASRLLLNAATPPVSGGVFLSSPILNSHPIAPRRNYAGSIG
jgi:hypothetical protein